MRNLKKILALVLALVMSMSLVTIANASDFTDSDDITYEEAADVMNAIGIIEGFEDGSFDPDGTLTREQAATLVARMLLGNNADRLGIETSTFKDVAVTRWSAPYIEYCASLGLIDGAGDGNFYPAGQLTGYAFAKVLLTALGYSSEKEGLTGSSWSVNVAALAMEVGLDDGLENGISSAVLTREEAAQMALNAICAPLVAYDNDATITVNGAEVAIGAGDYYYITTTLAREQRISTQTLSNTGEYTVEFGERYFPDLRLSRDDDDFDRPSHTWTYQTEEIGSYVDYDKLVETYTTGVTGRDLYDVLSASVIREYDVYYYVDGAENTTIKASNMIRTNTFTYDTTGKGVLTQVFVDHDDEDIVITSINTYLAKATADYNENKGELDVEVYAYDTTGTAIAYTKTIDVEEIPGIVDYQEDDYILVNWAEMTDDTYPNNMEIVKVTDPEVMTDMTVTKFSRNSYLVTDGEQYDYAEKGTSQNDLNKYYEGQLKDFTYNIYLDQYGYVIGTVEYSGELNYLFLTGFDRPKSNLTIKTATAAAIFLDGTMSEIQVNVSKTDDKIDAYTGGNYSKLATVNGGQGAPNYNKWFTYTTSGTGDNAVYTLTPVAGWMNINAGNVTSINSSRVFLNATGSGDQYAAGKSQYAYGNDESVYVTVDAKSGAVDGIPGGSDDAITEVNGIYTGVQSVDIEVQATAIDATHFPSTVYACYDINNYIIGAVIVGTDAASTHNYAFAISSAKNEAVEGEYTYWEFDAIVDGELQTLTVKEHGDPVLQDYIDYAVVSGRNALFELSYDQDGYVNDASLCVDNVGNVLRSDGTIAIPSANTTDDRVYGAYEFNGRGTSGKWARNPDNYSVHNVDFGEPAGVTLIAAGNTLYVQDYITKDVGVPVDNSNPIIFVVQWNTRGDRSVEEYHSLQAALNALQDVNDNPNDGIQFHGWVSGVMNNNGTIKYLVLKSNEQTPVKDDDGSMPNTGVTVTLNKGTNTITVASKDGTHVALTSAQIQETVGYYLRNMNIIPATWTISNDGRTQWPSSVQAVENTAIGNITLTLTIQYNNVSSSTPY